MSEERDSQMAAHDFLEWIKPFLFTGEGSIERVSASDVIEAFLDRHTHYVPYRASIEEKAHEGSYEMQAGTWPPPPPNVIEPHYG